MKSLPIQLRLANHVKPGRPAPRSADHRRKVSSQDGPQRECLPQVGHCSCRPLIARQSRAKHASSSPQRAENAKNEKVKTRNEVNLTSDNYGALSVLIRVHPSRLWTSHRHRAPDRCTPRWIAKTPICSVMDEAETPGVPAHD